MSYFNFVKIIEYLKQAKNQRECLERIYIILIDRYKGEKFRTYLELGQLLIKDPTTLWNKKYLICLKTNYLMRIFLTASGFFKNEDIKAKWTLIYFISPHQYLRIKMANGEFINIDIWGANNGIKFGDYARGFHC